jgi:DNA polymerase-3 subunit epsilon
MMSNQTVLNLAEAIKNSTTLNRTVSHHDTSSLKGVRKIASDTETTGLDKAEDEIIEIGGVEIIGNVITGNSFHRYINPGKRQVHPEALKVHQLSNEQLKQFPSYEEVIDEYLEWIGDDIVIFHNADFDREMFAAKMKRLGRAMFKNTIEDTLRQAQKKFPSARNSLDALCSRYGINNSHRVLHGALLDSEILAEVYIYLHGLNRLDLQAATTEQIIEASVDAIGKIIAAPSSGLILRASAEEIARHRHFIDGKVTHFDKGKKVQVDAIFKEIFEKSVDTAA